MVVIKMHTIVFKGQGRRDKTLVTVHAWKVNIRALKGSTKETFLCCLRTHQGVVHEKRLTQNMLKYHKPWVNYLCLFSNFHRNNSYINASITKLV